MNGNSISIIGGGPAGCSTGIFLSKEGFDNIRIYEKDLDKRKPCGGGISWRVSDRYKEFLKDLEGHEIRKCVFDFDGNVFDFTFKRNIGTIVDRLEFDKHMRSLAESYGVKIINKKIGLREIKTKYVVNAAGFSRSKKMFICLQSFAKMKNADFRIFFRKNINGSGYFWIFPLSNDFVNVGIGGLVKSFKIPIVKAFGIMTKELGIETRKMYAHAISVYNNFDNLIGTLGDKKILNVGEAANLVNPLTGEGIYYALRSGEVAAKSFTSSDPFKSYELSIKSVFSREFEMSNIAYSMISKCPPMIQKKMGLMLLRLLNDKL